MIQIGEYRLIPIGTSFWSIANQSNLSSNSDEYKIPEPQFIDFVYGGVQ